MFERFTSQCFLTGLEPWRSSRVVGTQPKIYGHIERTDVSQWQSGRTNLFWEKLFTTVSVHCVANACVSKEPCVCPRPVKWHLLWLYHRQLVCGNSRRHLRGCHERSIWELKARLKLCLIGWNRYGIRARSSRECWVEGHEITNPATKWQLPSEISW